MAETTYLEAIREALVEEMERDENVFLLGEDIGAYGGAFKVTDGLLARFGEKRVIDTPISEAGFVGAAAGAAHMGMRPVVEMQFIDFISCAYDMLTNYVATSRYRAMLPCPMVVRGLSGGYVRGGPFHSQNPEAAFLHTPGLKIVYPATASDAKGLLKSAIRDDNPVIVLEGEMLYNTKGEVPEEEYVIPLGKAELKREGDHATIVTNGKMVLVAMQVADQLAKEGIRIDVVDLRTVRPMDTEAIFASVRKTNRCVVLEEGWELCGIGAQVVDYVQRECFDHLDAPVLRVHQADVPMPYAKNLERAAKPDAPKTIAAVKKVMYIDT